MAAEAVKIDPGEHEILRTRIHWGILLLPILVVLPIAIATAAPILALNRFLEQVGGRPSTGLLGVLTGILIIPAVAIGFPVVEAFLNTEYVVTGRHLRFRTGWLMRASGDLLLQDIEAIFYVEPLLGQLLGYGTVEVTGKGGTRFPLRYVPSTSRLHRTLQDARDRLRTGSEPALPPPVRPSSATPPSPVSAGIASRRTESNPQLASPGKPAPSLGEAWRQLNRPPPDLPPDDSKYMPKR
jgi:uncharacterized membrane protein YdbT with pleckstrin-like domain